MSWAWANAGLWYALVGGLIAALSLAQLVLARDLLKRVVAVNLLGVGLFLILIAVGWRGPDRAPDAITHALVLTGIVVAVSATGLALALLRRLAEADDGDGAGDGAGDV